MKILNVIFFVSLITGSAFGQTVAVSGTVNDERGQPVPYAFVRDMQHSYATFADSTGTFLIKADPASSLEVSALSFKDAQLKIDGKTNVKVVLPFGAREAGVSSLKSQTDDVSDGFLRAREMLVIPTRTGVKEGFNQEPTRGSRYLYSDWVPGFGVTKKDSLAVEKTNRYNYDKISGDLLYTNDGKSMAKISTSQIKSFTIFDKKGHGHVYENVPAVSDKTFVEVLLNTPKYKIYKKVDTKLTRADFHTDGVLEMGHKYDEFVDNERYYFVAGDAKPQSISIKKSTLKKLLGTDADAFIASQGSRDVDEEYVKDLSSSLTK